MKELGDYLTKEDVDEFLEDLGLVMEGDRITPVPGLPGKESKKVVEEATNRFMDGPFLTTEPSVIMYLADSLRDLQYTIAADLLSEGIGSTIYVYANSARNFFLTGDFYQGENYVRKAMLKASNTERMSLEKLTDLYTPHLEAAGDILVTEPIHIGKLPDTIVYHELTPEQKIDAVASYLCDIVSDGSDPLEKR